LIGVILRGLNAILKEKAFLRGLNKGAFSEKGLKKACFQGYLRELHI
jgi:hypothetical protein